ncbi:DUF4352 domain-containing protein [candidate division KSB1 bacterium]|nr:DUF4352 domain-containing protein [candidate division KSB1 bacterium]
MVQAKIGVVVNVEHFVYRVDNVSFKKTVGDFFQETADGIYLIVSLSIKNVSNETRTLDGSMFKLINSQGHEFEHSTNGSTALEMSGQKSLFLKQCQPNIQTAGKLIFEVPDANDRYTLKVSGGFWTGKTADITLVK